MEILPLPLGLHCTEQLGVAYAWLMCGGGGDSGGEKIFGVVLTGLDMREVQVVTIA